MRQWVLKLAVVSLGILLVGIVVFFAFYGKVLSRATMTEKVTRENEDLKRYYYKVQLLQENLLQARDVVSRMTELAGIDYEFPELPDDSTLFAQMDHTPAAVMNRPSALDWTLPAGLPIDGFVTQSFEIENEDHYHPGVDIACAVGTPVLSTGSGVVEYVDYDSIYGHRVVIRHNDSISTIYAHNDEVLVRQEQHVLVGSRIALSGNSGKSTAPHLHYEVRVSGKPIDPMVNLYEEN